MFCNILPPPPQILASYEKMSKNMVEREKTQMTIWRRVALWISKATRVQTHVRVRTTTPTHTHARTTMRAHTRTEKYVILRTAFPRQQLFRERTLPVLSIIIPTIR